jgi:CheY-like chemotaxis protein
MLTFSRQTDQEKKPLQLSTIVQETGRFLKASIPATISIRVTVESESGPVLADPVQIQQVVMNLCTNAAHAMREKGGVLDLHLSDFSVAPSEARSDGMKPGQYIKLVVRDTGIGIQPEVINRIFDPFFTTKKPDEGTGLGLSVVQGIIQQHDGYITVESQPGKGSAFTVYLPKVAEQPRREAISDEAAPTGHERILLVDDEKALTETGQEFLEGLGYEVTVRNSSVEALKLFTDNPGRFDLIVTDQTMPGMTGLELARACMALRPDIRIVLATGFSHLVNPTAAREAGIRAMVMKPLTKGELARTARKALDG